MAIKWGPRGSPGQRHNGVPAKAQRSGNMGPPRQPNVAGAAGKGRARERADVSREADEAERTLRGRGERRSSGVTETCRLRRGEGYAACGNMGSPRQPSAAGAAGRGGARERADVSREADEAERTLRYDGVPAKAQRSGFCGERTSKGADGCQPGG